MPVWLVWNEPKGQGFEMEVQVDEGQIGQKVNIVV